MISPRKFRLILALTKARVSLSVTFSACTGFVLARGEISSAMIAPLLGVFFLACGSSGLNQYQERETDARMERTKMRPLPTRSLTPSSALRISVTLILGGTVILLLGAPRWVWGIGLFATLWYNGVYVYLKRRTALAVVPGALVGAVPPYLGWVSGGGSLFDPRIVALAFFFFVWQVPHSWLLLLQNARDYEKAGLPCLTRRLGPGRFARIVFIWTLSAALSGLSVPLYFPARSGVMLVLLLAATLWLIRSATCFLAYRTRPNSSRDAFSRLTIHAFWVVLLLAADRLLASSCPTFALLGHWP